MKKLIIVAGALIFNTVIGCQSNSDKEPSDEPYPGYDTTKPMGHVSSPDPDSVKSMGSAGDDQHVR